MTSAHFIDLNGPAATCRPQAGGDRAAARRVLVGHMSPEHIAAPRPPSNTSPGRVVSLGRFVDDGIRAALAAVLPPSLIAALRAEFEWYACRGAFFHNDAHYGGVLFGAWCVSGPARELVFARSGIRVPVEPSDWVAFDPFEPHAVLDKGAAGYARDRYVIAPASVFVGFELALDDAVRSAFRIGPPEAAAPLLTSAVAINAETGALR